MADPTSIVTALKDFDPDRARMSTVIKNAEALEVWALVALNRSLGKAEFSKIADDIIPLGLVIGASDGDNINHLTGDSVGTYKVTSRGGIILVGASNVGVSVTGASAITDAGKFVWATDGQTLTLTRQAGAPVGIVLKWISSTYCWVYLFDMVESVLLSAFSSAPSTYVLKSFGTHVTNSIQGTAAATLHIETSYEHYKIISWHAQQRGYDDAIIAGSQVLNLEIEGTTVKTTGGVNASALTLAYTSFDATGDQGTPVNASAVVSANEVHIGDSVEVVLTASGTGFTADAHGAFEVYAVIEKVPGV